MSTGARRQSEAWPVVPVVQHLRAGDGWLSYVEVVTEAEDVVRLDLLRDDAHALGSRILAGGVIAPVLQHIPDERRSSV